MTLSINLTRKQISSNLFDMKSILNENALTVLSERYFWKKKNGKLETPEELFSRVSKAVSGKNTKFKKRFFDSMMNLEFLPNSPTLMNAGKKNGQLAACFVLPLEDDLSQIMDTLKLTALIHQSGGGTGFNFSKLRSEGSLVQSSHGVATGPLGFLNLFNQLTENIKQGGLRRGANMGILSASHPDIEKFINIKCDLTKITNFNLSVSCTDKFMKAVKNNQSWDLVDPTSKKKTKTIEAQSLFYKLCQGAWNNGEPGLIFIDAINKNNPTPDLGAMEATNPCGEQPLLPFEACNLGSINLTKIFSHGPKTRDQINWEKLSELTETGVLFLNGVIDACHYPHPSIESLCRRNRKIGLGVMGFADLLILLKIPYGSPESYNIAEKIMGFIEEQSIKVSQALAKKEGGFEGFSKSLWKKRGIKPLRNATLTTVAPTGTLSLIAGVSPGIEPLFNFSFERHILDGKILQEVHPEFAKAVPSAELQKKVAQEGSLKNLPISEDLKKIFLTARDVPAEHHVRMQAEFQKHSHSAVSKTINLEKSSTIEEIYDATILAFDLKCKGITVYRDGSRPSQAMQLAPEICHDCTRS